MEYSVLVLRRAVVPVALVLLLVLPASARAGGMQTARGEAGMGIASVFANLFYIPMKLGYAAVGAVTGGVGYLVTGLNRDAADRIWIASVGGDYVLTRQMLSGQEQIHFIGTTGERGSVERTARRSAVGQVERKVGSTK